MIPLSENPPSRYPKRNIHESETPWWVAKVKPRQEKALAFDLLEKKVEYYLPMSTKVTRRRDNNKPRKSIVCLFPGYLSFCSIPEKVQSFYATNRIVRIIPIKKQKHFMYELDQIYHMLELGVSLEPYPEHELAPGLQVQVKAGPMRGVTGTIIKVQSSHKLILKVEVLGMAAVSIDTAQVEPLEIQKDLAPILKPAPQTIL